MHMYFTDASFNIASTLSKSAGLFKIQKVDEGVDRATKLPSNFP